MKEFLKLVAFSLAAVSWSMPFLAQRAADVEVFMGKAYIHTTGHGNVVIAVDRFEKDGRPDGVTDRVFVFMPDESLHGLTVRSGDVRARVNDDMLRLTSLEDPWIVEFIIEGKGRGVIEASGLEANVEFVRLQGIGLAQYKGDFIASVEKLDVNDLFGFKATLDNLEIKGINKSVTPCTASAGPCCQALCGIGNFCGICCASGESCCQCNCILSFCFPECGCL